MRPQELFEENLGTIDRVIAIVCRRARLFGADAEDFASEAKLALIENDYEILSRYEGRSSLDTYLTVVIQRLLSDARTRAKGKWHASAEAQRLGPAAVLLETLVRRDGRSLDEAMPHLRGDHPEITREEAASLLDRLPERARRPKPVDLEALGFAIVAADSADARVLAGDSQRISNVAGSALRSHLQTLLPEERLIIRLRFACGLSIADISRMMSVPQRPLYRRIESLLAGLRGALVSAGVDHAAAEELVGSNDVKGMDFGLMSGKSKASSPSLPSVADHAGKEP